MALPMPKKNSVKTTIAAQGIDDSTATIPVADLSVFYDKNGVLITEGIIIGFLNNNDILPEEITITGASGTSGSGNLTGATRGVNADGSIGAAHAWDTGTEIAVMFSTGVYLHIRDAIGEWTDSTITPTWTGGPPDITSAVCRHVRNGNVVTFDMTYIISNGQGAILESLTLPVAATQVANRQVQLTGYKMYSDGVDEVPSDPFAYVDFNAATPIIKFHTFGLLPSGNSAIVNVSGSYEVQP
jgi:hypothetical protein